MDRYVWEEEAINSWFLTNLDADGFLAEDVLDLSHGRGAFEAVLSDEDIEEDLDRLVLLQRVRTRIVANRVSMSVEPAPLTRDKRCRQLNSARWSGHLPKKLLHLARGREATLGSRELVCG
jgi:hypothetical protein